MTPSLGSIIFQANEWQTSELKKSCFWCICHWTNTFHQLTIRFKEVVCKNNISKITVKSLGEFYIWVKLQDGSLQLKNELVHRYFVGFHLHFYIISMVYSYFFCWILVTCSFFSLLTYLNWLLSLLVEHSLDMGWNYFFF